MTTYRHDPGVLHRRTTGAVLLRTLDGRATVLRGTGIALWDALEAPVSHTDLVDLMRARFDDPSSAIAEDVTALLERLVGDGLVKVDEP